MFSGWIPDRWQHQTGLFSYVMNRTAESKQRLSAEARRKSLKAWWAMSHTLRTQRNCILEILPSTEILMAGSRLLRSQRAYRGSMPQRAGERAKSPWSRLLPTADRAVTEHDGAPSLKLFLKLGNSLQSQPPVRKKNLKLRGDSCFRA